MSSRSGEVYWVTGAGSGIGLELVKGLASQGHRVIVTGRRREPLEAIASDIGDGIIVLPADVADDEAMKSAFSEGLVDHLDGIFLCAGICEYIDMPDLDTASIRRVLDVNFHGVVNSCAAALPLLRKAVDAGRRPFIAGVSSMSTYVGFPRAEAYGSAKAAMAYFLDSLRCDVGNVIDVTVIYPGFVDTPLTEANDFPMPTMVTAEYAAGYILKKIARRPLVIVFPRRLHLMLKTAALFSGLWYRKVVKKLSRSGKASDSGKASQEPRS